MRLLLVRHGQTPSNVAHLLDTAVPGPGLTALGEEQAAALPKTLASERIEALYASTLHRTQLTAAPLAAATGLQVQVRDGLRELAAGDLEMRGDAEAAEAYLSTAFAWSAGELGQRMPGGEDGHETFGRLDSVVAEAAASGAQTVAMVSHGAAIRTWTAARASNVALAFATSHELRNTGVVRLVGGPNTGWQVERWEDHTFPTEPAAETGPAGERVDVTER